MQLSGVADINRMMRYKCITKLVCGLTAILLLTACSPTPYKAESSAVLTSSSCVFYTADGLYRANPDGSDKMLLKSGGDLRYIGSLNGWVYFTDEGDRLRRTDTIGRQEESVTRDPVQDAIMVNDTLYYIEAGKVFCLDTGDQPLIEIPQDILALPFNFKTNGKDLFICTYGEQGNCSVYQCGLTKGSVDLVAANIYDNPFVLYEDEAIQVSDTGTDNQIYKQSFATGEKQVLLSYTGLLYDMCVCDGWLLYITQPGEGGAKYMNGYDLHSGHTFQLEAPGDYIYQTTATHVLIVNSEDLSMSRFIINGDTPSFSAFSQRE
jgi:hypothetical protein